MKLAHTRRMVSAALSGELDGVATSPDPVFGLEIPQPRRRRARRGPRAARRPGRDPAAYDAKAKKLAEMFPKNFEKFAAAAGAEVAAAGLGR